MKKFLLTIVASLGITMSTNAQLAPGSIFPDFTLTDINGQTFHLYAWLDSGYTVFIDVSATWCYPCWQYHTGGYLDTLYEQHGPSGMASVSASTTNDVLVLFVQGEPTSGLAELYDIAPPATPGSATLETPDSTCTQGNWVAGTLYPIIDDSTAMYAYGESWDITGFPTIYMICRDHLVHSLDFNLATSEYMYAAKQSTCPSYPPSPTVDAKATPYMGSGFYICSGTPTCSFQNYSQTDTISSATINVLDASKTIVTTQAWSGTLPPYAIANVNVSSFAPTSFGGYSFSVNVVGDTELADNYSADSLFKIYAASNATSVPYAQNFAGAILPYQNDLPDGFTYPSDGYYNYYYELEDIIGPDGSADTPLLFDNPDLAYYYYDYDVDFDTTAFIFGNYNTASLAADSLQFDECYALQTGIPSDTLDVLVSTDCGSTWNNVWEAHDSALETAPAVAGGNVFFPNAASDWRHVSIGLSTYDNSDMLIDFVSHASGGDFIFVDNVKLTVAGEAVSNINGLTNEISIYPNPATDLVIVSFTLSQNSDVSIEIYDEPGNLVKAVYNKMNAGNQQLDIPIDKLSSGIYNVKISTGGNCVYKNLSVLK